MQTVKSLQIPKHVMIEEYAHVLASGTVEIATRFAPWMILGFAAWKGIEVRSQWLLASVASAVMTHFLLFPSPQDRYYTWAYIIVAAICIESLTNHRRSLKSAAFHRVCARSF